MVKKIKKPKAGKVFQKRLWGTSVPPMSQLEIGPSFFGGKRLWSISNQELSRLISLGTPSLTTLMDSYEAYQAIPKDYVTGTITYKKKKRTK